MRFLFSFLFHLFLWAFPLVMYVCSYLFFASIFSFNFQAIEGAPSFLNGSWYWPKTGMGKRGSWEGLGAGAGSWSQCARCAQMPCLVTIPFAVYCCPPLSLLHPHTGSNPFCLGPRPSEINTPTPQSDRKDKKLTCWGWELAFINTFRQEWKILQPLWECPSTLEKCTDF